MTTAIIVVILTKIVTFIRAIRTIIIITTICKDALSALVVFKNSRIVANAIYLVYIRFIVELVIISKSIYLRNRNMKRTTLNTYIILDF
jgi:hypothetical protein